MLMGHLRRVFSETKTMDLWINNDKLPIKVCQLSETELFVPKESLNCISCPFNSIEPVSCRQIVTFNLLSKVLTKYLCKRKFCSISGESGETRTGLGGLRGLGMGVYCKTQYQRI